MCEIPHTFYLKQEFIEKPSGRGHSRYAPDASFIDLHKWNKLLLNSIRISP